MVLEWDRDEGREEGREELNVGIGRVRVGIEWIWKGVRELRAWERAQGKG